MKGAKMTNFNLKLLRHTFGDDYTEGFLYAEGVYYCDTLEPKNVDVNRSGDFDGDEKKIWGETAIPFGKYRITLEYSPKFKRKLPYLHNVTHFTGILIHVGNSPKDTAGCILVGERSTAGMLINSKVRETELTNLIASKIDEGFEVFINVMDN